MKYNLESIRALIEHSGRRIWNLRRAGSLVSEGEQENEEIFDALMNLLPHHPQGEYVIELRTAKNSNRNALSFKFDWGEQKTSINGIEAPKQQTQSIDNQFIIGELTKERARNEHLQQSLKTAFDKVNELNLQLTVKVEIEKAVQNAMATIPRYEPPPSWTKFAEIGATAFGNVIGAYAAPNIEKWGLQKPIAHALAGVEESDDTEEYEESAIEQVMSKHFKGQDVNKLALVMDAFLSDPEMGKSIKAMIASQLQQPKPKNKIGFA